MTWDLLIGQFEQLARDTTTDEMPKAWRGFSHQERIEKIIESEQAGSDDTQTVVIAFLQWRVLPPLTLEQKWFLHWRAEAALAFCHQLKREGVPPPADSRQVIAVIMTTHWQKTARALWRQALQALPDSNPEAPLPPSS
jgi:hypothetical protein